MKHGIAAALAALTLAACGSSPPPAGSPPHHTADGYQNLYPFHQPGLGDILRWRWEEWTGPEVVQRPERIPRVQPDLAWLAANRSTASYTWLGHASGLLQLGVQVPALLKIGMVPRIGLTPGAWRRAWSHPGVKRVLRQMAPAILGVSVAQISLLINTQIASHLGAGSVSWLTYADRLMEFPTAMLVSEHLRSPSTQSSGSGEGDTSRS